MNILRKITWETMKRNRSRSIVTIIGVLLSATLFTAVTVFTGSLFHFLKENYIYDLGNYHIRVRSVDDSFLEKCEKDKRTEALLAAENLGYALIGSQNEDKPYLYVSAVNDDFFSQMPVHLTLGRMPENVDEILLPTHLADNGKVYYSIGDQITLELGKRSSTSDSKDQTGMGETDTDVQSSIDMASDGAESDTALGIDVQQNTDTADVMQSDEDMSSDENTQQTLDQSRPWQGTGETWTQTGIHEYTVVGFYERPSFEPYSAPGYTALTKSDASDQKEAAFVADAYIRISQPSKNLSSYILDHDLTDYDWMQNNSVLMLSGSFQYNNYGGFFTGIVIFFCVLIFAGSVALIYNAFSISVSERTQQFGLLSSLGATKKQIRKMVWQEAFLVSAIGIPLGIVTGIVGIGITLHFVGDKFNGLLSSTKIPMTLHVQWSMLFLAALIALATVLISAWVPSRRAMKVTAMEAIRQSKDVKLTGKEVRTGRLSMKLFGLEGMLGKKYFRRSRKKYRATIVSLAFSVILFIAASSYTQYLKESLVGNAITVSNYDVVFWTDVEDAGKEIPLDELKAVQGVKEAAYSCSDAWMAIVPGNDIAESYLKYDREVHQKAEAAVESGIDPKMSGMYYALPDSVNGVYDWSVAVYYLDEESYEKLVKDQGLNHEKYLTDGNVLPLVYNKGTMEQQIMSESYNWKVDFLKKGVTSLQGVPANVPDMDGYEYYGTEMKDDNGTPQLYYSYVPEGTEADIDSDTGKLKNGYLVPAQTQTIELGDRIDSLPLGIEADHTGLVLIYPYHMLPSDISDSPSCYFNTNDHDVMLDGIKNLMTEKGFHVGEYSISDPYEIEQKNRNTVLVINVFTYGFIVLISLIAIANAFHTISTNLLLRRRDFAMLKSMGMTEKGMHRMLNYECLIYGSRALMYGLPIGFLTNVCIARITSSIYRGGFRMPVAAYLLSIICVFAVVFVTMLYAMKKMTQDNPVEVLKNENL